MLCPSTSGHIQHITIGIEQTGIVTKIKNTTEERVRVCCLTYGMAGLILKELNIWARAGIDVPVKLVDV